MASRLSHEEVRRRIAAGGLTRLQVYALEHQHPFNHFCHMFGVPLVLFGAIWLVVTWIAWGWPGWEVWLGCQVVGWTFQFTGHRVEGNKPAFFADPLQLLVGPVFYFLLKPREWLTGRPAVVLPPAEEPLA